MIKPKIYQSKKEWLTARGIGGSSASVINGHSKWQTLNDLYNQLVCNKNSNKDDERMKEGRLSEEFIRKLFIIEHKQFIVVEPPIEPNYWLYTNDKEPLLTLTPDGLLFNKETKENGFLEIKDIELRKKVDKEVWASGIPSYYFDQLLHYFIVIDDLKFGILQARLKVYVNKDFDHIEERSYLINRKDFTKEIKELKEKELKFLNENVKKKIRPVVEITFKKGEIKWLQSII